MGTHKLPGSRKAPQVKLGKDSGLAGPQVYPQVYAVLPLLKNASDLVHPQPRTARTARSQKECLFSPPLNFLSPFHPEPAPVKPRPLLAHRSAATGVGDDFTLESAMVRAPSLVLWPERRVPRRLSPFSSRTMPAVADLPSPRARRPAAAPPPGRAPRFSVRPSRFHDLLKSARRGAQPLDPPHAGIPPGPPVAMPSISLGTPELPASMSGPTCPPSRSSRSISAGLAL